MDFFNPVPKPQPKEKKKSKGLQTYSRLQAKKPMNQKRSTPRNNHKDRTKKPKGTFNQPSKKVRGQFGEDYDIAIEKHGATCGELLYPTAGNPPCSGGLEMHHVTFRSQHGRGKWRNARPLCKTHHDLCDASGIYAEKWRAIHRELYGEHYDKDEWDLWNRFLIDEPTKKKYEEFMKTYEWGDKHGSN